MNEADIIQQIVAGLDGTLPPDVDVRTSGGDQTVDPPEVIVSWSATPLPDYAGHRPDYDGVYENGGYGTGNFGSGGYGVGNLSAKQHEKYSLMRVEVLLRYADEYARDQAISTVQEYFYPFESRASAFDPDTAEWEVGTSQPTTNPYVEPDWYVTTIPVEFVYVKYIQEDFDVLDNIDTSVDVDNSLTQTTTEIQ